MSNNAELSSNDLLNWLEDYRKSLGMTQIQFAKHYGYESATAVSLWESGYRDLPSMVALDVFNHILKNHHQVTDMATNSPDDTTGSLRAAQSSQSSEDTADDRLDEILSLYTAACNVQDEHGNTYYDFSYIEAKKAIASYLAEQEAARQHLHVYGMDDYRCVFCKLTNNELRLNTEHLEFERLRKQGE